MLLGDRQTWWRLETKWQVPSIYGGMLITTAYENISQWSHMYVLRGYLQDLLSEQMNPALDAGYELDVDVNCNGLELKFYGWSNHF